MITVSVYSYGFLFYYYFCVVSGPGRTFNPFKVKYLHCLLKQQARNRTMKVRPRRTTVCQLSVDIRRERARARSTSVRPATSCRSYPGLYKKKKKLSITQLHRSSDVRTDLSLQYRLQYSIHMCKIRSNVICDCARRGKGARLSTILINIVLCFCDNEFLFKIKTTFAFFFLHAIVIVINYNYQTPQRYNNTSYVILIT